MQDFLLYLQLGFRHIADLTGYDHILFVAALTIPFAPSDWRRLAWLVTAFTAGHSITLALATLRLVSVPAALVETLIPATIIVTAALAVIDRQGVTRGEQSAVARREAHTDGRRARGGVRSLRYALAVAFGLVHGLGFSSYLRALLGAEESIALPLFAFNVGLEFGQLCILLAVLIIGALVVRIGVPRPRWSRLLAGVTGGLALMLLIERLGTEAR